MNRSNNDSHESNNNNELNDDLNDENEIIIDKEDSINDEDESIDDKEDSDSESELEEDESIVDENLLQDQITDHYLDYYNDEGSTFLSISIKYKSKTWKRKKCLNVKKKMLVFLVSMVKVSLTSLNGSMRIHLKCYI